MMTIVAIRQQAALQVAAILGPDFKELPFQIELEANESRSLAAGFAVSLGSGGQNTSPVDQLIGIEQELFVDITKRVFVRSGDKNIELTLDDIYSSCGAIINAICRDRLGLDTLRLAKLASMSEPKKVGKSEDVVSIRLSFRIAYLN